MGHTGNVEEKEYLVPKEIQYFSRKKVVSIFAGLNCSFAVDYTGNLYGWGEVIVNGLIHINLMLEYKWYVGFGWRCDDFRASGFRKRNRALGVEFGLSGHFWKEQQGSYISMLTFLELVYVLKSSFRQNC